MTESSGPIALDAPWFVDWPNTTMLEVQIRDGNQRRLIVELSVTDFQPDELRAIADHLVAIHNSWLQRQRHLDRQKASLPRE